jgi:hypothetical protein
LEGGRPARKLASQELASRGGVGTLGDVGSWVAGSTLRPNFALARRLGMSGHGLRAQHFDQILHWQGALHVLTSRQETTSNWPPHREKLSNHAVFDVMLVDSPGSHVQLLRVNIMRSTKSDERRAKQNETHWHRCDIAAVCWESQAGKEA